MRCSPLLAFRKTPTSPVEPDSLHFALFRGRLMRSVVQHPSCRVAEEEAEASGVHSGCPYKHVPSSTRRGHLLPRCPRGCISNRASKVPRIRARPGPPETRSQPCVAVSKPQIPGRVAWHTCAASPPNTLPVPLACRVWRLEGAHENSYCHHYHHRRH